MKLDFSDEMGKKRFEFCFVGFIIGGSMQDKKGLTVLRNEIGLFEKFESISDLKPCGKKMGNGEPERQLKTEGVLEIQISPGEFDMLYSYIANVPWQTGSPGRSAYETLMWLQMVQNGRNS